MTKAATTLAVLKVFAESEDLHSMTLSRSQARIIVAHIEQLEARERDLEEKLIVHFGEVPS